MAALIALCSCAIHPPAAVAQQEDTSLSAEAIIQILQENPDILAEAKSQIVAALRERGLAVSESDITDERLFSQIRSDDRVRLVMSDELKQRGYGLEPEAKTTPQPQKPGLVPAMPETKPEAVPSKPGAPRTPGAEPKEAVKGKDNEAGRRPSQSRYPYRNLPALRELYMPSVVGVENLERFGAALFRNSAVAAEKPAPDLPAGVDYVLGYGDELVIQYWGSVSQRLQVSVDRQGRLTIPEAGPIMVAGRTLAEAEQLIQKALTRQYRNISVDVTLAKLRMLRIYVVGDVKNPGAYEMSSLSTALNAVLIAGGPTDVGSFRTVKHFRAKKLLEEIDLYDFLLRGLGAAEAHMESGDSILVPPVGPQVTVAGMVRRPAIYELLHEDTLGHVLETAGGILVTGELNKIRVERIEAHERREVLSIELPEKPGAAEEAFKKFAMQDGDIVTILPITPYGNWTIYLTGHVARPGKYPYHDGVTVADMIASYQDLLPEPADRAEIVRLHAPDNRPYVIPFSLRDVLEKRAPAPALNPLDTVRVYGRYEADAPKVAIYGEVIRPGEYPLSDKMTATDLVRLAGGFKRSAYADSADLASYSIVGGEQVELEHRAIHIARAMVGEPNTDAVLKPGDVLTINQLGGWRNIGGAIILSGEVVHPGRYGIVAGEKISSVIKRAGGFRPEAYPNASILERQEVREVSARNRDELIQNLQAQAVGGTTRAESIIVTRQRQQLIDRLKQIQPNGRLVIHISADVAKWENTLADISVRPGDTLTIPKKPNFVMVTGQVYNPTAISFFPGKRAGWYLKQTGGPTRIADKKAIFVVRSNGSVVGRNSGEWWATKTSHVVLLPGDTVYVPENIAGGEKLKTFAMMAQILSGLAVAARVAISF
ncbi:MAG TPA: SLBB domain-containing protein [Candidatus Acidoferrum sp.]|nr:SLBB domain-containing protein [Candidatus Acidoferrum sp.]